METFNSDIDLSVNNTIKNRENVKYQHCFVMFREIYRGRSLAHNEAIKFVEKFAKNICVDANQSNEACKIQSKKFVKKCR